MDKPKKASQIYMDELKDKGREPTKEELRHLGKMIISEKVFYIKEKFGRIKRIFERG